MVDKEPRGWGILAFCIYGGGEGTNCQVRKKGVSFGGCRGGGVGGWGIGLEQIELNHA